MVNRARVIVSKEGTKWLNLGQMWLYKNNVISIDDSDNGAIVDIYDEDNNYYGSGFLSLNSHITVRIITKNKNETIDNHFFEERIKFAYAYRKTVEKDNLDNCRIIFGEADQLPGLTVDRYNQVLVCQISCVGMENIKNQIYKTLLDVMHDDNQDVDYIYERNDIKVRVKEGLPTYKGFYGDKTCATSTIIDENGIKLNVDFENGQKTGYFLDQKSNRVLLRHIAKDKSVLDCFSHTGGFALNAAYGGAKEVTAVDVSQVALDQGLENAKLNNLENRIKFIQDDVFDYLDKCSENQYDIIVLDPPAFTKSRKTINQAYNGYKRINMQAMKLLRNGGYLITCSCSHFMAIDNFEKMLKEAATEAEVILRQVSITQQNSDHPILWTMEESSYLKYYIFQII